MGIMGTIKYATLNITLMILWGLWFIFLLILNVNGFYSPFTLGISFGIVLGCFLFYPICKILDITNVYEETQYEFIKKLEEIRKLQNLVIDKQKDKIEKYEEDEIKRKKRNHQKI